MKSDVVLFWFRRDLRLHDNAGLYHALNNGKYPVIPIFIFDDSILDALPNTSDARVEFIYNSIQKLYETLINNGKEFIVSRGNFISVFNKIQEKHNVKAVFTNHDYEPLAISRDTDVLKFLETQGITFQTYKDQVVFEKNEILKSDGTPYTIFTPYSKKWKLKFSEHTLEQYPSEQFLNYLLSSPTPSPLPKLEELGFKFTSIYIPELKIDINQIKNYATQRDFPILNGTSQLGIHLRFGTLSLRELISQTAQYSEVFLNELIWREFYMMILFQFPHVVNQPFNPQYQYIEWDNNTSHFERWCQGETGYPLVDAAMRCFNSTGLMHNRLRMVTASFLVKHLLIDWRWGEQYFANQLLDFELASNNGGWQWCASTGCDAAPYFRIFNPALQLQKFDSQLLFIKKWIPDYHPLTYRAPIVNHQFARERVLSAYKKSIERFKSQGSSI